MSDYRVICGGRFQDVREVLDLELSPFERRVDWHDKDFSVFWNLFATDCVLPVEEITNVPDVILLLLLFGVSLAIPVSIRAWSEKWYVGRKFPRHIILELVQGVNIIEATGIFVVYACLRCLTWPNLPAILHRQHNLDLWVVVSPKRVLGMFFF